MDDKAKAPEPAPEPAAAAAAAPAATQPAPEAAAEQGDKGADELADIQWLDGETGRVREVKIATQSANGPCPLLALANVLALAGQVRLGTAAQRTTTAAEVAGILANRLFDGPARGEADAAATAAALAQLPRLHRGMDVDPRFGHVRDFANAGETQRVFAAFGVDLVHGWVADPAAEPHVVRALDECGGSYERAVEYILAADELHNTAAAGRRLGAEEQRRAEAALVLGEWLRATATQLTECGLAQLQAQLAGGSLSVMFRNNHFSTLLRRGDGRLFLLCTDDAVAADPRLVWESLDDVHQATAQFVDSQFLPLEPGADGNYAHQGARAAAPGATHDQDAAAQIDSDFALALRLQEQEDQERAKDRERRRERHQRLQVRQDDALPPGMAPAADLYAVPEAPRTGRQPLHAAQGQGQSQSQSQGQARRPKRPDEDRCALM
ncbi:hypothetical protein H4R18_003996 [Coemansia javaensis]|uniref:MINDY deubiquitinase domain-containing protein n=1 Tax=Coemansia javaensis TaxID=2761396 RepID=A0A9W8HCY2_9FUNG|nr:hypothetical protein H4R18_003996 [Coemansia javaensis]